MPEIKRTATYPNGLKPANVRHSNGIRWVTEQYAYAPNPNYTFLIRRRYFSEEREASRIAERWNKEWGLA